MSTPGVTPQPKPSRVRRFAGWAREAPAKRIGGPVGAAALAVSGAFGGWAAVPQEYAEASPGEPVSTGPLEVTVTKVQAIDDLEPLRRPKEGNRFLLVRLDVRNVTDQPVRAVLLTNQMQVRPERVELTAPTAELVRFPDLSRISEFQPDLDYHLIGLYETHGQRLPSRVQVALPGYTWREDSFTPGFFEWKDPEIVARGEFDVIDVPDAPQPSEPEQGQ